MQPSRCELEKRRSEGGERGEPRSVHFPIVAAAATSLFVAVISSFFRLFPPPRRVWRFVGQGSGEKFKLQFSPILHSSSSAFFCVHRFADEKRTKEEEEKGEARPRPSPPPPSSRVFSHLSLLVLLLLLLLL